MSAQTFVAAARSAMQQHHDQFALTLEGALAAPGHPLLGARTLQATARGAASYTAGAMQATVREILAGAYAHGAAAAGQPVPLGDTGPLTERMNAIVSAALTRDQTAVVLKGRRNGLASMAGAIRKSVPFEQLDRLGRAFHSGPFLAEHLAKTAVEAYMLAFVTAHAAAGGDQFEAYHPEHDSQFLTVSAGGWEKLEDLVHPNSRWSLRP